MSRDPIGSSMDLDTPQEATNSMNIVEVLPPEVCLRIFSMLNAHELLVASQVSKAVRVMFNSTFDSSRYTGSLPNAFNNSPPWNPIVLSFHDYVTNKNG